MAKTPKKKDYIFAVGRRKTSVARVRLHKGRGESQVNGKSVLEYFPGQVELRTWELPFSATKTEGKYWVSAKIAGGGKGGQFDALLHGTAHAMILADESFRPALKKLGFLTRDSRTRERRKVGHSGKSRFKKQSPKR